MWKALLGRDLQANAPVLLGLWAAILVAAGLSLIEPWRVDVVFCFTALAPVIVAGLLTVTLGTSEAAQDTAPFLDGLPVSRRRVWGMKLLLVGLHLAAVALIGRALIALVVHTAPHLNREMQMALSLSLQAAMLVALLALACAVASVSVKQATLRLLFWGGSLVAGVAFLQQIRLGQAIFLQMPSQPVLDWLFRAVLFAVALVAAGAAWRQAARCGALDVPLRRRRMGRATFLGTLTVGLLATPLYLLSPRGTVRDIVRVDSAQFSPDGQQLLLQTMTRRWGREFFGRLWWIDWATGAAQPFGPGHLHLGWWNGSARYRKLSGDPIGRMTYNPRTQRAQPIPLPARIQRELRSGVRYAQFSVRPATGEVFFQYRRSSRGSFYLSLDQSLPRTFSTPDGRPLSFLAWDPRESGAFLMAPQGSTHGGEYVQGVWWVQLPTGSLQEVIRRSKGLIVSEAPLSPDGQWLCYRQERSQGRFLHVIHRDGTRDRVFKAHHEGLLQWSADSRYLAVFFPGADSRKLLVYDVTSDTMQRFRIDLEGFPRSIFESTYSTELIHPVWSPDSERLAFVATQTEMWRREVGQPYWRSRRRASLWVLDRPADRLQRVATLSDVEWGPDAGSRPAAPATIEALAWDARGRVLVVSEAGEFYAVDPETGEREEAIFVKRKT